MAKNRRYSGFTLIEIVLVLAIAGLLMVIVFAAVSQAQKSRRDAQRKRDLAMFVGAVGLYAANNNLQSPEDDTELDNLLTGYFSGHNDPLTGVPYVGNFWNRGADHDLTGRPPISGEITFVQGHACGSDAGVSSLVGDVGVLGPTTHVFAALIWLEQGDPYCLTGGN